MKSSHVLKTAAAVFLSVQLVSSVHARVEIPAVDPENYVSKEVPPEIARGGIQELYDRGVLLFQNEIENRKLIQNGGLRSSRKEGRDGVQ